MKRNILIRIGLVPLKILALIAGLIFISLPCLFINEEEFGDRVIDYIMSFGNYTWKESKSAL